MGVYIEGMEMPNNCMACPLFSGNGCRATKTLFAAITNVASRVDSCPLTEVPEPHGRLIDADKAVKDYHDYGISHMYDAYDLADIMAELHTVIERSK